MVDKEAKWYLSRVIQDPSLDANLVLDSQNWNVLINNSPVTGNVSKRLTDHITSANMKQFLIRTNKLTTHTYDLVDWDSSERAIRNMSSNERVWVTKFASVFVKLSVLCQDGRKVDGSLTVVRCAVAAVKQLSI